LLFLHGSDSNCTWQPFMDRLAQQFEVIAPDHPGFGNSEIPQWLDETSDLAHAYRAFIEQLGLREVVLVGHGLGGWIACELALANPDRISHLILVDAAGLPLTTDGVDPFMCSLDELRNAAYSDIRRAPAPEATSEVLAKDRLMTARLAWHPRFYSARLAKWLHRLSVPTLIVWGQNDRIFPVQQAQNFASVIGNASVNIIGDAGHLPHIEQPFAFASAITAFVEGGRA